MEDAIVLGHESHRCGRDGMACRSAHKSSRLKRLGQVIYFIFCGDGGVGGPADFIKIGEKGLSSQKQISFYPFIL